MTRRQPDDEFDPLPGTAAGLALVIGLAAIWVAAVLVALGWISLAVSMLAPLGAPLDENAYFVETLGATASASPDCVGEVARSANGTSTTYLSRPATPLPANGAPARDAH
jgi:hypothetical protein